MKTEKRKKGDRAQLGDEGEEIAFLYLKRNGYKILARNYENKFGEIDIIALRPIRYTQGRPEEVEGRSAPFQGLRARQGLERQGKLLKPPAKIWDRIVGGRGTVVFLEVKTRKISASYKYDREDMTQGEGDELYPESNVDWKKQKKLVRAAEYYLIKNKYPENTSWQIDVIGVVLDSSRRLADLRHIKNAVS